MGVPRRASPKTPRKTPRQERSRATVEAIFGATTELAKIDGIEAVSMAAIGKRAGVSTGSLYQYFATRDALLAAWEEQGIVDETNMFLTKVGEIVGGKADSLEGAVRAIVELSFESIGHRYAFYRDRSGAEFVSRLQERMRIMEPAIAAVAAALDGFPSKRIRRADSFAMPARIVVWSVAYAAMHYWVSELDDIARLAYREEVANMVVRYLLHERRPTETPPAAPPATPTAAAT